jgi:2-polyprenyl-3-methyl-5-hydroxy-6-metoxy-1,4-benzoquinol methylase
MKSVWQREKPTQMKNRKEHEEASRRLAARFKSRFLHGYVASKLRTDPAYPAVYELMRSLREPLLDVGCGLGLLCFYLRERGVRNPIVGLDGDARKIREAQRISSAYQELDFRKQDLRKHLPPFSGNVAVLDVLHYLTPPEQKSLLASLAERVAPGAVLVLRDCPRDPGARYWLTYLAEKFTQIISWNVAAPIHFPSRESVTNSFSPNEFVRDLQPLWGATPFNNHLFIFRRHPSAVAPVAE